VHLNQNLIKKLKRSRRQQVCIVDIIDNVIYSNSVMFVIPYATGVRLVCICNVMVCGIV